MNWQAIAIFAGLYMVGVGIDNGLCEIAKAIKEKKP